MDDFDIDESIDIDSSDSFETTSLDSTVDVMDSVDVSEESFDAVELDDTSIDDYSEINEDSYNSEIDDIMNDAEIDNLEFDSDIEEIPEDSLDVMDDVSVEELDFDDTNSIEDSDIVQEELDQPMDDQFEEIPEEVEQPTEEIDISAEENVQEDVEQSSNDQFEEMSERVEQPTEEIDTSAEENVPEDVVEVSDVEEVLDPHEALNNMSEYMNEHNYGLDDYETYSQDPEWQALNRDLQIANGIEPTEYTEDVAETSEVEEALDPHEVLSNMSEYMNEHNYGLDDYETYSQDSEWQALNRDLQVANGIEPTEYAEDVAEIAEENENEIVNNIENLDREYDDFERSVIDTNPDFYETGSFYQQGINEFGYQGTCGPTSQANAINELLGTNELTENKVLSVAIDNNLCQTHGDMDSCGGTSTEQFMDLYDKMNEQLGDKFDTELFEYGDVLDADQVADRLDNGDVVNVAVDACALWDMPRDYVNDLGVRQDDFYSDHWITVTGVQRLDDGTIKGFDIIDSGGGENYVSLDKYNDMCFGTEEHRVIDPTCIVLSKKDVGLANGSIDREIITDTTIENDNSTTKKSGLFDRIFHKKGE